MFCNGTSVISSMKAFPQRIIISINKATMQVITFISIDMSQIDLKYKSSSSGNDHGLINSVA